MDRIDNLMEIGNGITRVVTDILGAAGISLQIGGVLTGDKDFMVTGTYMATPFYLYRGVKILFKDLYKDNSIATIADDDYSKS